MLKKLFLFVLLSINGTFLLKAQQITRFESEQQIVLEKDTLYGTLLTSGNLKDLDIFNKPVVIFISGSGPTDRDGNSGGKGSNAIGLLADSLLQYHIASFRYDKPGVGKSTFNGELKDFRFKHLTSALSEVVDHIDQLGFKEIYLAGHSQGSLLALIEAESNHKIKGVISLAGAGEKAISLLKKQIAETPFMPDAVREETILKLDSLDKGLEVKKYSMFNAAFLNTNIQDFIISFNEYNPAEVAKNIKAPLLIVQGQKDLQIDMSNAEKLKAAKPDAQLLVYEEMNHVLKKTQSEVDNYKSYNDSSFPLQPGLTADIANWIKKQAQ